MSKDFSLKIQKPMRARNSFLRAERERKAAEAKVRKELAAGRSPDEQIRRLDAAGYTAAKERAKLAAIIAEGVKKLVVEAPEAVAEVVAKEKKGQKAKRQSKNDKKGKK